MSKIDIFLMFWCSILQLAFIFAWVYIRLFQHHELSEVSSTLTAVFGLFVALLTSAVMPVDAFLVSYMKNSNGTFKVRGSIIYVFKFPIEIIKMNTLAAHFSQMILYMQTSKYCVMVGSSC